MTGEAIASTVRPASAGPIQGARAEGRFDPVADRVQIDPDGRQRIRIEVGRGVPGHAGHNALSGGGVQPMIGQQSGAQGGRVCDKAEQQVLGAYVGCAEPTRMLLCGDHGLPGLD